MTLLMLTWTSSLERLTVYSTNVCHPAVFLSVTDLDDWRLVAAWLLRLLNLGLDGIPAPIEMESGVPCVASVGD